MNAARTQLTVDQVADIQGLAEELRVHSVRVEELLTAGIADREKTRQAVAHHKAAIDKATLLLALAEEQTDAFESTGRVDVARMRQGCAELRAWIEAQPVYE